MFSHEFPPNLLFLLVFNLKSSGQRWSSLQSPPDLPTHSQNKELDAALCWPQTSHLPVLWDVWNSEHVIGLLLNKPISLLGRRVSVHLWESTSTSKKYLIRACWGKREEQNEGQGKDFWFFFSCCFTILDPRFGSLSWICHVAKGNIANYTTNVTLQNSFLKNSTHTSSFSIKWSQAQWGKEWEKQEWRQEESEDRERLTPVRSVSWWNCIKFHIVNSHPQGWAVWFLNCKQMGIR